MDRKTGKKHKRNWTPEQIEKQRKYGHSGGIQKGINARFRKRKEKIQAYYEKQLEAIEIEFQTAMNSNDWRRWIRDRLKINDYRKQTEIREEYFRIVKEQEQKKLMDAFEKGKHPEFALLVPYLQKWMEEQQQPQRRERVI